MVLSVNGILLKEMAFPLAPSLLFFSYILKDAALGNRHLLRLISHYNKSIESCVLPGIIISQCMEQPTAEYDPTT